MPDAVNVQESRGHQFGTFAGVFTPSILTILGLILFMRSNFVTGHAGIRNAILILLISKAITFMTTLSLSAITTNMQVRGGGAYYIISRVLGLEYGGAIGITLFLSLALSVPFYLLGFAEALVTTISALAPHLSVAPYFEFITLSSATVFFVITYIGASWAIRTQYFIMVILALSIIAFLGGAAVQFSPDTLQANWAPLDTETLSQRKIDFPALYEGIASLGFWTLFALYFPAVTGINAGVNMSGDLKEPARSIPKGTLLAVGVGFLVYLATILVCGGAFERIDLIEDPFGTLTGNALFGMAWVVAAGAFAATLSSALGSFLGAPRVLQAVSRDPVLDIIRPFGKGVGREDEPRPAVVLTMIITTGVLLWAGNKGDGAALNHVAEILSMFFLYTYGVINVAAFIEAFGQNPSFRPRFRMFHWFTALLGAVGCLAAAFLINWIAALFAGLILASLIWAVKIKNLESEFGDARRGFVFNAARKNLVRLSGMREDPKNWRPTILLFSGHPGHREALVSYAIWLEAGHGVVFVANVLVGDIRERSTERQAAIDELESFCRERKIAAFPSVIISEDFEHGFASLIQTTSLGPVRPNLALFGWSEDSSRAPAYYQHFRTALAIGMGLVIVHDRGLPDLLSTPRIDVWWRGEENGHLMILLTDLLVRNWEWRGAEVRILRVVREEWEVAAAEASLQSLIEESRIVARARAIVSIDPFPEVFARESHDATCTFLGMHLPTPGEEAEFHAQFTRLLKQMPTTILVKSVGKEDIRA
jgi:amino acid transporter